MIFMNLVKENCESPFFTKVYEHLKDFFDDDTILCIRTWNQACSIPPNKKFISIITSAEGHRLIPHDAERLNKNCLGVFLHYYPKDVDQIEDQFNPNLFLQIENVHQLQLGSCNFTGNSNTPILEREYDVSFVGQLDPYTRSDFFHSVNQACKSLPNSKFVFYTGWNNGLGSEEYGRIMSQTKIALVPQGSASLDTFRFYEAFESGCVVITIKQNNYEFMRRSPHIEIPSWSDARDCIDRLLKSPSDLVEISNETKAFWNSNLSPTATAKLMLRKLGYE